MICWEYFVDTLEKDRLSGRKESYFSYERVVHPIFPHNVNDQNTRFMTTEQIGKSFSSEHRQLNRNRTQAIEDRRKVLLVRETARFDRYEAESASQSNTEAAKRLVPGVRGSNVSGQAFDIVSQQYHDSPEGKMLASRDAKAMERKIARQQYLAEKAHYGYNPLTNESLIVKSSS